MPSNVPILNRVLVALILLMTTTFFFAGLAAGVYAVLGESFFYGGFLIKLFPYQDSLHDLFRALMRIVGGIWPATVVVAISHVIIRYLTEGKQTALVDLADMRKGFLYQLTHPFSNPRTPMNSSEEENTARTNFTTGAVIVFVVSSIFALVFLMLGKIVG